MKMVMFVMLGLVTVGVSGCGGVNRSLAKGEVADVWSKVSDKETVRVRGIGAVAQDAGGTTQRRGLSRNAALVAARYEALALIKGVTVRGGLTVGKLMEKDSHIQEVANRIINGFEEVQTEWAKDDGCVVLLELPRSKLEKLLSETAAYESSDAYRVSLDQQIGQSEERQTAQRAKFPGMAATQ
ncbi:MAG: hypothetical protein NDJ72_00135 [Elusimicrobia bacterium]|nr:hypothetical protein [Elusimicrobiota bacterium]